MGKIRDQRENITLQRKIMQVDMHTEIEEKFSSKILARFDIKPVRKVYPNKLRSRFIKVSGNVAYVVQNVGHSIQNDVRNNIWTFGCFFQDAMKYIAATAEKEAARDSLTLLHASAAPLSSTERATDAKMFVI